MRRRVAAIAAFLVFFTVSLAFGGVAEAKRVALIIGNSKYDNTTSLANPVRDAKLVADSLRDAGFDKVSVALDLNLQQFNNELRSFRATAEGAEIALIYYAGHGIEEQGRNWLLPVNARLSAAYDLPYEAVDLNRALETLAGAELRMVVLDACRNNPFARSWTSNKRAVSRGLAEIQVDDMLVIYAAAPGQVATDGDGDNSPFARSLAQRLPEPGVPVQMLGGLVRDDVLQATNGEQRPFVSSSVTGQAVYLVQKREPKVVATAAAEPRLPIAQPLAIGVDNNGMDALTWQGAMQSNSIGGFQAYLSKFPNGLFAGIARENIKSLSQRQAAFNAPVPSPAASAPSRPAPVEPAMAAVERPTVTPKSAARPAPAVVVTKPKLPAKPPAKPTPVVAPEPVRVKEPTFQLAKATIEPEPSAKVNERDAAPPIAPVTKPNIAEAAPSENPADRTVTPPPLYAGVVPPIEEPELPLIPAPPTLDMNSYPDCREAFAKEADDFARAEATNKCTERLDRYYNEVMLPFRRDMISHQDFLSSLYKDKVAGNRGYSAKSHNQFYKDMMAEHAKSDPGGEYLMDYRTMEKRYNADRAYQQERYCEITGCQF